MEKVEWTVKQAQIELCAVEVTSIGTRCKGHYKYGCEITHYYKTLVNNLKHRFVGFLHFFCITHIFKKITLNNIIK